MNNTRTRERRRKKVNKTAQFGGNDLGDKILLLIIMNLSKRHHVVKPKIETTIFLTDIN